MARAYIVLARNDLDDSQLQVLDLAPNSSQLPRPSINPDGGQTGYLTHYFGDAPNAAIAALVAGPPITFPATVSYGLQAYLLDTVEVAATDRAITVVMVNNVVADILAAVVAGTALTAAVVNAILVARVGAGTALSEGDGTATLEEILRILAGEVYRVPALAVLEDGVPNFIGARRGAFVTAPNVLTPDTVVTAGGLPVRGRASTAPVPYIRPGEPRAGNVPVQTGTQDTNFRRVRQIVDTGDLHLSATNGVLAELAAATYAWINPGFDYAAGGVQTRATTIAAANIPATGVGRAITVYDALGNVIV